ncbi:DUF2845 domain-containing protein [Pseudaeromonas sharmana]|uniref:DUF2845 domain-containing protein n=1 Tax=Pseudaeromonas sharmana TaxID=328412 RepID=A0ABV8CJN9_9GAMM
MAAPLVELAFPQNRLSVRGFHQIQPPVAKYDTGSDLSFRLFQCKTGTDLLTDLIQVLAEQLDIHNASTGGWFDLLSASLTDCLVISDSRLLRAWLDRICSKQQADWEQDQMSRQHYQRVLPLWAGVLLAAAQVNLAEAGTLRCGNSLLTEGDSTAKLLTKCGKPMLVEPLTRTAYSRDGELTQVSAGERWTYDRGRGSFYLFVMVENGIIRAIEDGPRK